MCTTTPTASAKLTEAQSIFKHLPEMLKKRQSSTAPTNLKRPAPSSKPQNAKTQSSPTDRSLPRLSTLSAHSSPRSSRSSTNETGNSPKNFDDGIPPKNPGTRPVPTPELATKTVSPSETLNVKHLSSPSTVPPLPSSMANQDMSGLLVQPFSDLGNVPDLMPIMFPSDDPLAYPMQPMSTLEDGHFRADDAVSQMASFSLGPAPQRTTMSTAQSGGPSGPSGPPATTMGPVFDSFSNLGAPGMGTAVPSQLHHRHQSHHQSPVSRSPGGGMGEPLNSPDLVLIPNQNFAWPNYNFQPQRMADQAIPQQMADNGSQALDLSMDGRGPLGMDLDLGIPLDDVLGNDAGRSMGNFTNDEWLQWMNAGG